jgi:hypothetical protein
MGHLPFYFLKRPIFLPGVCSRKRERHGVAGRDLVIVGGAGEAELQRPTQFAVDWPALSMTCRPIGGIFEILNPEPIL